MIPRRPRPLCAICADRDATTITDWECESGAVRTIVACWPCLSPVPDPPEQEPDDLAERMRPEDVSRRTTNASGGTRAAVMAAVRRIGRATAREVVVELGAVDNAALTDLIRQHLRRLTACGALTLDRSEAWRASDPGVYRATGGATTRTMADSAAMFAELPEEFSTYDVAPDHRKAAGIVRTWRREGLISCVRTKRDTTVDGQRVWSPAVWRKTNTAARAA